MKRLFMLCLMFTVGSCTCNYSDGERVGVPYKLSRKGLLVRTYEGEMNLGGTRRHTDENGGTSLVPNIFEFTVRDDDEANLVKIRSAIDRGASVKITYTQVIGLTCQTQSGYFVENVEILK